MPLNHMQLAAQDAVRDAIEAISHARAECREAQLDGTDIIESFTEAIDHLKHILRIINDQS